MGALSQNETFDMETGFIGKASDTLDERTDLSEPLLMVSPKGAGRLEPFVTPQELARDLRAHL